MLLTRSGKVVMLRPPSEQFQNAKARCERYGMGVDAAHSVDELERALDDPGYCVLLAFDISPATRKTITHLRGRRGWKALPVLVVLPDEQINDRMLALANKLQVELLPSSWPEGRVWLKLCEAQRLFQIGRRRGIINRRKHFRLPLKAKATLIASAETVDISVGGVCFLTNRHFHLGDRGRIDIRSLLGDMDEEERGFEFEVVSLKLKKDGPYRFAVGAKFIDVSEDALIRLKQALEVIEPTMDNASDPL